jgi:hypothetical protein
MIAAKRLCRMAFKDDRRYRLCDIYSVGRRKMILA